MGFSSSKPIKEFNNGNSCIVIDDGCYVILNLVDGEWRPSPWIFPEAWEELTAAENPRMLKAKFRS